MATFSEIEALQADVYNSGNILTSAENDGPELPEGWILLNFDRNDETDEYYDGFGESFSKPLFGFAAATYFNINSGEVVISFRGTEPEALFNGEHSGDFSTDIVGAMGELPGQTQEAEHYYRLVQAYLSGEPLYDYGDGRIIQFTQSDDFREAFAQVNPEILFLPAIHWVAA